MSEDTSAKAEVVRDIEHMFGTKPTCTHQDAGWCVEVRVSAAETSLEAWHQALDKLQTMRMRSRTGGLI